MSKATFVNEIPNEIKGNEVPTVELVQKMITSENIKVKDFGEFTFSNEKKYFGIPIVKFVLGEDFLYPYNEFTLTFWTDKNEFYKCWGVNQSDMKARLAVQKIGQDLGENELKFTLLPIGDYDGLPTSTYCASLRIDNEHLSENGITTISHVRLSSKDLDLPDEIDFDLYTVSQCGVGLGPTIPIDLNF